jgi:hypothetical protein
MFQSVAADLVEDFCGKFLEDVDAKQLNVSMWNGQSPAPGARHHSFSIE